MIRGPLTCQLNLHSCWCSLDSVAPPSELLEMCEQSLEEMGAVFDDSNVYMLHMMYQAMGVCLYMQDAEGAIRYGEKILRPYRCWDTANHTSFYTLSNHAGGKLQIVAAQMRLFMYFYCFYLFLKQVIIWSQFMIKYSWGINYRVWMEGRSLM